jgi:hypothetical protein
MPSTGVISSGCAASSSRSGIGSDSTLWRTARRAEPEPLATERQQLVVAALVERRSPLGSAQIGPTSFATSDGPPIGLALVA